MSSIEVVNAKLNYKLWVCIKVKFSYLRKKYCHKLTHTILPLSVSASVRDIWQLPAQCRRIPVATATQVSIRSPIIHSLFDLWGLCANHELISLNTIGPSHCTSSAAKSYPPEPELQPGSVSHQSPTDLCSLNTQLSAERSHMLQAARQKKITPTARKRILLSRTYF